MCCTQRNPPHPFTCAAFKMLKLQVHFVAATVREREYNHWMQASAALGAGNAAEAERLARSALEVRRQSLGPGSKEAAAAMCTLSDALRELGRCGPGPPLPPYYIT